MSEIKKRKPQPRCKCGHARKNHDRFFIKDGRKFEVPDKWFQCGYCYVDCEEFRLDPLTTWERLYEFNQAKISL